MKTESIETTWHILRRTGRVYSTFPGTLDEAQKECDTRNVTDEAGATEVYASFPNKEECREAFYLLID